MSKLFKVNRLTINGIISIIVTGGLLALSDSQQAVAQSTNSIVLSGTIRDFQGTHPNFGFGDMFGKDWSQVGNHLTEVDGVWVTNESGKNIVTTELGADSKPIFNPNSRVGTVTNAADFNQWYNDTPGVNLTKSLSLNLYKNDAGMYQYSTSAFFPINNQLFGNIVDDPALVNPPTPSQAEEYDQWETQGFKNRNYFFTYETHNRFVYKGGEVFTFSGDDDVWVYINGKRVIDLSGVHAEESETFILDAAKASELGLTIGQAYDFNFFFAERNYSGSNFTITTNIELNNAPVANQDTAHTLITNSIIIDVLANDTDADGDEQYITDVVPVLDSSNPDNMGIIAIENNKLVYNASVVPGEYTFNYTLEDEHGDSDSGILIVTVTAFPD